MAFLLGGEVERKKDLRGIKKKNLGKETSLSRSSILICVSFYREKKERERNKERKIAKGETFGKEKQFCRSSVSMIYHFFLGSLCHRLVIGARNPSEEVKM